MAAANCPKPSSADVTYTFNQLVHGKAWGKGARWKTVTVTGPNQYKNDGSGVDFSTLFPTKVIAVIPGPFTKTSDSSDSYMTAWVPSSTGDPTAGKVLCYRQSAATSGLTEVPDATVDMSGYTAQFQVFGY